jgi:hypothetical protein
MKREYTRGRRSENHLRSVANLGPDLLKRLCGVGAEREYRNHEATCAVAYIVHHQFNDGLENEFSYYTSWHLERV